MYEEPTRDRPSSFRKAINNSTLNDQSVNKSSLNVKTTSPFSMYNHPEDYGVYDLPNPHHNIPTVIKPEDLIPKSHIKRNHSTDSTSSDVSLLSSISTATSPSAVRSLLAAVVTLAILFLASLVYILLKLNSIENGLMKERNEMDNFLTGFCVPCDDVRLGPFEEDNEKILYLDKKTVNRVEICCAKTPNQTIILTNLIVERNHKKQKTEDILDMEKQIQQRNASVQPSIKEAPVAAHLLVGSQQDHKQDEAPFPITNLLSTDPIAHVQGLRVTKDMISINTSGLYFVYSQIYFSNINSQSYKQNTSQALYHYVYRYNVIYPNGGSELLLKSVRTLCWAKDSLYTDFTSYTAAAFQLNAGDKLYVMVSDIATLSRETKASFFGIFKIS
uniref:TNF ligand-like 3 n=1 Tax=Mytilus galloprovincialis TaxID=29158 RepID=A0A0C5PRL6_MYTGA|nr:TNF ligand-like 3 [Mytilus galloprovincialis]